jgi:Tol biopolymer transport system component
VISGRLSISPDGKLLAFLYDRYSATPTPGWKLAVIPVNGGQVVNNLDMPGGIAAPRWSPNGKGLQYLLTRNGATNLWEQPLSGEKSRQLTRFTSGQVFDFNWMNNGKQLLLTRGQVSSDVVLLRNLR